MAYTYHELKGKTIQELREIAKGNPGAGATGGDGDKHELVQGYSQMNKEHLLPALCKVLGIDIHEHHVVVGIDKPAIKAKMRALKQERQAALDAHDHETLRSTRRQLHHFNRMIRSHAR
jgi:hypothetical protein